MPMLPKQDCLQRMLQLIPKHKGTERLQANLKTRLKEARQQQEKLDAAQKLAREQEQRANLFRRGLVVVGILLLNAYGRYFTRRRLIGAGMAVLSVSLAVLALAQRIEFLGETFLLSGIAFLLGTVLAGLREGGGEVHRISGCR